MFSSPLYSHSFSSHPLLHFNYVLSSLMSSAVLFLKSELYSQTSLRGTSCGPFQIFDLCFCLYISLPFHSFVCLPSRWLYYSIRSMRCLRIRVSRFLSFLVQPSSGNMLYLFRILFLFLPLISSVNVILYRFDPCTPGTSFTSIDQTCNTSFLHGPTLAKFHSGESTTSQG